MGAGAEPRGPPRLMWVSTYDVLQFFLSEYLKGVASLPAFVENATSVFG